MNKTKSLVAIAALMLGMNAFAVDESASKTFPTPQSAEGAHVAHLGIVGGYVDQIGPTKPTIAYGVDAGFQPYVPFGVGFQALFYNANYDRGITQIGIKRTELMLRGTYNFGGDNDLIRHSYIGVKTGAVINKPYFSVNNGASVDGDSYTRLGIAPVIGFDAPIAEHLSAGIDLSYLFVMGPEKNTDVLQALGSVKYWFQPKDLITEIECPSTGCDLVVRQTLKTGVDEAEPSPTPTFFQGKR